MAVRAQQPEIALIGFPIRKATGPAINPLLSLLLLAGVNVVDIQDAKIVDSADGTFSAKLGNQCQLAFPYSLALVNFVAVFIPECFATFRAAIANLAGLSAVGALSVFVPTMGKVARLATKFASSISESVGVHFGEFAAMLTNDGCGFFSHSIIVSKYVGNVKPKYFDIAVKRIEAELNRFPLFEPKPAIQRDLLDSAPTST